MQQTNSNESGAELDKLTTEKQNTAPQATRKEIRVTYENLKTCVDQFFNDVDYQSKTGYKRGYACSVGEDFTNIDMLSNLFDIVYNHCTTTEHNKLTKNDKKNFKETCDGIKKIINGMSQYNDVQLDKILISTLIGYILKITRNYFND